MVPDEVEKLKKTNQFLKFVLPTWFTTTLVSMSPHRESFSALRALSLQQQHLDPFSPHPSCTGKRQLESICFGTQSPATLLGTFGYFTA